MFSHAVGSWSCGEVEPGGRVGHRGSLLVRRKRASLPRGDSEPFREPVPGQPADSGGPADRRARPTRPRAGPDGSRPGPARGHRPALPSPRRRRSRGTDTRRWPPDRRTSPSESAHPAWVHSSANANSLASTCATATRSGGQIERPHLALGDLGERSDAHELHRPRLARARTSRAGAPSPLRARRGSTGSGSSRPGTTSPMISAMNRSSRWKKPSVSCTPTASASARMWLTDRLTTSVKSASAASRRLAILRERPEQAGEQDRVGDAIEDRVHEGSRPLLLPVVPRDRSVEDVAEAGREQGPAGERTSPP